MLRWLGPRMHPTIGIQRAQQGFEIIDLNGRVGDFQPQYCAVWREGQGKPTSAASENPAFNLLNIDRQMADMVTACDTVLECVRCLTAPHSVEVGRLHCHSFTPRT